VTGEAVWATWAGEAVMVTGIAMYIATDAMIESTYCENCDQWTKETLGAAYISAGSASPLDEKLGYRKYQKLLKAQAVELKQHLEAKDLKYLEHLGVVEFDSVAWYQLDMHSCATCQMFHTLRVKQFQRKQSGKKITEDTDDKEVMCQLLLTTPEADQIRGFGKKMPPMLPLLMVEIKKQAKEAAKKPDDVVDPTAK